MRRRTSTGDCTIPTRCFACLTKTKQCCPLYHHSASTVPARAIHRRTVMDTSPKAQSEVVDGRPREQTGVCDRNKSGVFVQFREPTFADAYIHA